MENQEVATCCRLALALMSSGGAIGPRLAQVNMATLFVRDGDFLYDLAAEMAQEMGDLYSHYHEIKRANDESDAENVELRHARSEALSVASDVVDAIRSISTRHPRRWRNWEKMVRKQTLRQIMRGSKKEDRMLVASDISWCAWYVRSVVGEARLEKLLTLRSFMA